MRGSSHQPRLRARERGRARRRLRYLRQVRELQLRDAGGFVFDLYRFGERRDALVRSKLDALIATDREIRELEAALGVSGHVTELRQPGVGGTCANCGAFHAGDARYCDRCGVELSVARAAAMAVAQEPAAEEPVAGEEAPLAEAPTSVEPEPAAAEGESAAEEIEPAEDAVPPEPDTDVTVVRGPDGEASVPEAPAPNGAAPAGEWPEGEANANGDAPPAAVPDPDTGEVAAVGRPDLPRARRSRTRRRRGTER